MVESPSTSLTSTVMSTLTDEGLAASMTLSTASLAIWPVGWATVVSEGRRVRASLVPSKPTTLRS